LIITGIGGGIWLIVRRRERTEASSSPGASLKMMINNRREDGKEEDYRFTPKKVLLYCIIVGLISAPLSIFITSLILLSVAAFVFASITVWYLLGEKFRWREIRKRSKIEQVLINLFQYLKQQIRFTKV
jgi:hypothetical protein